MSRGFATRSRLRRSKLAVSPRTYLTWGKWHNLAEHILQNIHVNDNDASTHTLHIALVQASLHIFPWKEKMMKFFISNEQKLTTGIKNAWKEESEPLYNTSRFLEMELWRLKVHAR